MFGWLVLAAPLALIFAIGAAVWLEGHIVDQPTERLLPGADQSGQLPTAPPRS